MAEKVKADGNGEKAVGREGRARERTARERMRTRCWGDGLSDLMLEYHDREWGTPLHDDLKIFEFLVLEGMQAGLSWTLILNKRENFRRAFKGFDPEKVARFGARDVERLLADAGIVRNRLKIMGAINNAKRFLEVLREFGTFDRYIWSFVGGTPTQNAWQSLKEVPARTPESDAMSADLKRRGFKFVGSTICYAFMQAVGMVNDHVVDCFRHRELARTRRGKKGG